MQEAESQGTKGRLIPKLGWTLVALAPMLYLLTLPMVQLATVKACKVITPPDPYRFYPSTPKWLSYYEAPADWVYLNTPLSHPMYAYEQWWFQQVGEPWEW